MITTRWPEAVTSVPVPDSSSRIRPGAACWRVSPPAAMIPIGRKEKATSRPAACTTAVPGSCRTWVTAPPVIAASAGRRSSSTVWVVGGFRLSRAKGRMPAVRIRGSASRGSIGRTKEGKGGTSVNVPASLFRPTRRRPSKPATRHW